MISNGKNPPARKGFTVGSGVSQGGQQGRFNAMTKPGRERTSTSAKGSQPSHQPGFTDKAGKNFQVTPQAPRPGGTQRQPIDPGFHRQVDPQVAQAHQHAAPHAPAPGLDMAAHAAVTAAQSAALAAPAVAHIDPHGQNMTPQALPPGHVAKGFFQGPNGEWLFRNEHGAITQAQYAPTAHNVIFDPTTAQHANAAYMRQAQQSPPPGAAGH